MNWLKNTSGKRDSMFSFACIAFAIVTTKLLLSGWTLGWGDKIVTFNELDAGLAGVYLGATFTGYWARMKTKTNGAKDGTKKE